ncbi:hypothetical protein BKA93DRAFT_103501 [Sparassis latifolia]
MTNPSDTAVRCEKYGASSASGGVMGQHMRRGRGAQTRTTHVLCHRGLPDTTTCSGCLRGRLSLHQVSPGSHPTAPPSHTMWHVSLHLTRPARFFRTYRICANACSCPTLIPCMHI